MEKMFECLFAYICKNNYVGECSPADQIYTITKGLSESETSIVLDAVQQIGRAELSKIDYREGVSLYPKQVEPNFSLSSYTYLPAKSREWSVFSCASLRNSLKDKHIRGSKELSHVLVFNNIREGFYAIDLLGTSYFAKKDIDLDLSKSIELANEDLVCEVKPPELDELSWDGFYSHELTSNDISLPKKQFLKTLAEFVHALLISKKNGKKLYVVYKPDEYKDFLSYLKATLKLFPAAVANKLSFITALGKTSRVNVDICGVPTCDAEYIAALKEDGNVIKITGFDVEYLGGDKGSFASFLEKASIDEFEEWLESLERYKLSIKSLGDINIVASLYSNIVGKDFDSNNPRQSLIDISDSIKVIVDKFDVITLIEEELKSQIDGVGKRIRQACGAFWEYSTYDIEDLLIEPIVTLYNKCRADFEYESRTVFNWLKDVLFGLLGVQTPELEKKHFEIFSVCLKKVKQLLGDNYQNFILSIENNWNSLKPFFDRYLNEPAYSEVSAEIVLSLLQYYLSDLSITRGSRISVRDYFVEQYLQKNPDQFDEIVKGVFANNNGLLNEKLSYILGKVIKINSNQKELLDSRISYFCKYVKDNNLLNQTLEYVKNTFARQYETKDDVINRVFNILLHYFFAISSDVHFDDIYNAYFKIQSQNILSENSSISLKQFVYRIYAESVLMPNYEKALKKIRFEDFNDATEQKYRAFVSLLRSPVTKGIISDNCINSIESLLDDYLVYSRQTKLENELLKSRIDFVHREFLLLQNKTIYKLLEDAVGAEKLESDLQVANITENAIKHPKFLRFAEKEAVEFLSNRDEHNQQSFCEAVRRERSRIFRGDPGIIVRDMLSSFISAAIFAVLMAVLAGFLSTLLYKQVFNSYFKNIYIIFVSITLFASFLLYWTNYRYRRLRNMLLMSVWQSLLFIISTIGVFALTQYLLTVLTM